MWTTISRKKITCNISHTSKNHKNTHENSYKENINGCVLESYTMTNKITIYYAIKNSLQLCHIHNTIFFECVCIDSSINRAKLFDP